jgi:glycine/D-amino acid oxidase-like deaminating enzyme
MSRRVVIVGGGVVGLCTAWYCVQRGFDVTLVERNGEERDGCSFGNAGMLVGSHFVPLAAPGMVGARAQVDVEPGVAVLREAAIVERSFRLGLEVLACRNP